MRCKPIGPTNAKIAIVGEAPGANEEEEGIPFVGAAGYELKRMLADAGINKDQCFITNVVMDRPPNNDLSLWINPAKANSDGMEVSCRGKRVKPFIPNELERCAHELRSLGPNIVIAAGNTALWALTSVKGGVAKWRGSVLESDLVPGLKVIPTYHPAAILRQYDWRYITVQDYRRARKESAFPEIRKPPYGFITGPNYAQVISYLDSLLITAGNGPTILVADIEIKRHEILCIGIADSKRSAFCIPFYGPEGHYFSESQHVRVVELLYCLFTHPNIRLANQNISFDIQYLFWRFGIWPKASFDTMIAQNVLFAGLPKSLDFLASMYCDYYVYWKDDGKFWDKPVIYPQLWEYNCWDCVHTFEVMEAQQAALKAYGLEQPMAFQMRVFQHVMKMMLRGVLVDTNIKDKLKAEIISFVAGLLSEIEYMVGWDINISSPKQLMDLFYERLRLPIQKKKTHVGSGIKFSPTCDDDALKVLAKKEPLIAPLIQRINMIRSYATAASVCDKKVDKDGRWRTSYNIAATVTYRMGSSENPFDSGVNLQNLTIGKDIL